MLPIVTHQVTVVRPQIVPDAHGNRSTDAKNWATSSRSGPWPACVQPSGQQPTDSREDDRGGRERTTTTVSVYLDETVDVRATDGVEIDGQLYQVLGDPTRRPDPIGPAAHQVLTATLIRG
ncbi:hypothetical protein GCM10027294_43750 [Marinactinospora endophytica]